MRSAGGTGAVVSQLLPHHRTAGHHVHIWAGRPKKLRKYCDLDIRIKSAFVHLSPTCQSPVSVLSVKEARCCARIDFQRKQVHGALLPTGQGTLPSVLSAGQMPTAAFSR